MEELLTRYAKIPIRRRLGVFGFVVFVLVVGHYFLIYSEQASRLEQLEQQHEKLQNESVANQAYAKNLTVYEARIAELQAALNTARSQLPDDPDVPQLLAQLGNKARQAGLAIDRFEPKGDRPQDFYGEIIFDMKVHGSYHEIGTFLDALGKLDRILNVTGLSMTSPRTVNQKVVVDCGFTIKTYRFLEPREEKKGGKK